LDKTIAAFPQSKWAAEAQYYKGLTFEKVQDVGKAADAFKTLVDRYPYSDRLNDAIEHEFELAEAMMGGKKTKFLGMAIMPALDKAASMYRHIVKSAPFGPYGAVAQYRLGDAELKQGNFFEAEEAYQAVIDEYPNSEYAPQAKYKIAQVSYQAAIQEEHHGVRTDEALVKFTGFQRAYPDSQNQYEASEAIRELRDKKARDIYDIAVFYENRKKYKSAKIYYEDVAENFPRSAMAEAARERLELIRQIEAGEVADTQMVMGIIPVTPEAAKPQTSEEVKPREQGPGLWDQLFGWMGPNKDAGFDNEEEPGS